MIKAADRRGSLLCLVLVFLLIAGAAGLALAHSAVLWCYVEKGRVFVEAFFMGGEKIRGGKIIVVDAAGNKLLEGTTDKEGLFDFDPPIRDDMTVVLRLDQGHGTDFTISKEDFREKNE